MIFTDKVRDFMTYKMCVDVDVYEERINKYSSEHINLFQKLGTYLHTAEIDTNNEYYGTYEEDAYELIGLCDDMCSETVETIHILIHAFMFYRHDGQLSLYYHTETDDWEPLTKVSKSLHSEMEDYDKKTFNEMNEEVVIYRGTCQNEADDNITNFGQSWTTNIEKARYFAYTLEQAKTKSNIRVIMEAKINKKHIYAYYSQGQEYLCIVDTKGIIKDSVKVVEKNHL